MANFSNGGCHGCLQRTRLTALVNQISSILARNAMPKGLAPMEPGGRTRSSPQLGLKWRPCLTRRGSATRELGCNRAGDR